MRWAVGWASILALLLPGLSGCSSSSHLSAATSSAALGTASKVGSQPLLGQASGTAEVAYAGSLELVNQTQIGPRFTSMTGAGFSGRAGGSFGLAREIAGNIIHPNVFESVGGGPIGLLEPSLTRYYVQFASSPLVVAYNPSTKYAPELRAIARGSKPLASLFTVMASPGFLLGRTNPETDPQGQAFVEMVELAQRYFHLPPTTAKKVLGPTENPRQIFAETALDAQLQAGQLDAASAFLSQALQFHLPYVALPAQINFGNPSNDRGYASASIRLPTGKVVHGTALTVDITTLGPPGGISQAAEAFVAFVLSPTGETLMTKAGYDMLRPKLFGSTRSAPQQIRAVLARWRQ
ncbi:MAG: extracellular solute-binding protein [Actinobacteria bacterium]|nr:extracellular solute-binding protein [Actinomycetota bacterium]